MADLTSVNVNYGYIGMNEGQIMEWNNIQIKYLVLLGYY